MQNGKGDKPRPIKNRKQFLNNWDEINWNKPKNTASSSSEKKLECKSSK